LLLPHDRCLSDDLGMRLSNDAGKWVRKNGLGLTISTGVAAAATAVAAVAPLVGAPVTGVGIGLLVGSLWRPGSCWRPGIALASKRVLQAAVVILGSQLSIIRVFQVGLSSLPVMLGTLSVCLGAAWALGRRLKVSGDIATLIGAGTGICGASAIAAVAPVIDAVGTDLAYAVSTIFLFNIVAVVTFPLVGHALGMSQHTFGLFAGTAVNDTSSVVAAATTYGAAATRYAVVVKLARTLMIIPICVALALARRRTNRREDPTSATAVADRTPTRLSVFGLVPWFVVGFLVVAAGNSAGLVPSSCQGALKDLSTFLITVALSAIGLSADLPAFRRAGPRPLLLGLILWLVVSLTSLGLQALISW
jgi:uncharacterized integral membrane protein (TIGR00698 family)